MVKKFNLFISHSWTYSDAYSGLIKLLDEDDGFLFKTYSVPKSDPVHTNSTNEQLYEAIKGKMAPCSVVLMISGLHDKYDKWVDKEIKIAKTEFSPPKSIIAIAPWGTKKTPNIVNENADIIVEWSSKPIIDAIKECC